MEDIDISLKVRLRVRVESGRAPDITEIGRQVQGAVAAIHAKNSRQDPGIVAVLNVGPVIGGGR